MFLGNHLAEKTPPKVRRTHYVKENTMTFVMFILILIIPIVNWRALKHTKLRGFKRFMSYIGLTWIVEIILTAAFIKQLV